MTAPKRWPNYAEEYRLEAISYIMRSLQELRSILDNHMDEAQRVRAIARAMSDMQEARLNLINAKGE